MARTTEENPRQQTQAIRPRLSALLPRKHAPRQNLAKAYRTHGNQMREIADHLGLHYSTVSRRIRQAEEAGA
jgi:REP-associated tyrosine transposase